MPRTKKTPTKAINIRIPTGLLAETDKLIADGRSDYSDRTDIIKNALRKEVDFQKTKIDGYVNEKAVP
ncbi:MAG: ribbon-helix-helix domain-containing protein [Methanomassiliicoccales archaeon]|jgi:metal-responsive CopG/Arc/MetJ family transcriptional regulator